MPEATEVMVPIEFELFRERAYQLTGLDLTSYKAPQMHRRLTALLGRLKIASFAEYTRVLEKDAARRQEFRDYVTINVSEFFRDRDRFADLERRILPTLLQRTSTPRVWSAGCSIGAEAYSIAILLKELAPGRAHSILGTDVDQTVLERARLGTDYIAAELRNAGPERIRRWFVRTPDDRFSASPALRLGVRFARHDLLRDAFVGGPFDLIACRNVIIYFTEAAKERIYGGFVDSLATGGVLFLGGTEAIIRPQDHGLAVTGPGFYRKV